MSQQFLVIANGNPIVVSPNTSIVTKQGQKQFWFYLNGKAKLAVQNGFKWLSN